jgi:hypothetical protein
MKGEKQVSIDKQKIYGSVQNFMQNLFRAIENGNNQDDIQQAIDDMMKELGINNEYKIPWPKTDKRKRDLDSKQEE